MVLALLMDQHVPRTITNGLRLRGVDMLTAFEDGSGAMADADLLDRATALGRVLFTRDDDLLKEATRRQIMGAAFDGGIYAHQLHVSVGQCIHDLELLMLAGTKDDLEGQVVFLPL